jgi:uncharacterized protein YacL
MYTASDVRQPSPLQFLPRAVLVLAAAVVVFLATASAAIALASGLCAACLVAIEWRWFVGSGTRQEYRVAELVQTSAKPRILDTSVIIDGRIAEIAATGFVEGTLLIPRFVLAELQHVADSSDGLKRARGRRGLDVLQRIQSERHMPVEIIDDDFSGSREVDRKLIEVAKARGAALVTNDFNLNKVASLEGVTVLNINALAGALRPVALPGETMRVLVAKEGKEHAQGVAYLDDGTMVVVENGRRAISKTIDVTVTSVLQTTAGKMIFARLEDKASAVAS